MANDNPQFNATARIPVRPLDFAYRGLAKPKELLVDYETGLVYVVKEDKTIVNITEAVINEIGSLDEERVKDIMIVLDDGSTVSIEAGIVDSLKRIGILETAVGTLRTTSETYGTDIAKLKTDVDTALKKGQSNETAITNETSARKIEDTAIKKSVETLTSTVSANKAAADSKDAEIVKSVEDLTKTVNSNKSTLDAKDKSIETSVTNLTKTVASNKSDADTKISANATNITNVDGKLTTHIDESKEKDTQHDNKIKAIEDHIGANNLIIETTILSGADNWTAVQDSAPYMQEIALADIKESDYPIVDIVLSEDYSTAVEELDNYAYIVKILTFNGKIEVYASEPTNVALNILIKTDRKAID